MSLPFLCGEGVFCDLHLIYCQVPEKGSRFLVNWGEPNLCLLIELPATKAIVCLYLKAFPEKTPPSTTQLS